MSPLEAYQHMMHILEQANAIVAHLHLDEVLENQGSKPNNSKKGEEVEGEIHVDDTHVADVEEGPVEFSPVKGNVVFSSAYDGWAFRTSQFAEIYARKLGFAEKVLRTTLWGSYYLDPKTKTIFRKPRGKLKPMFVQFVLEPLWEVYNAVQIQSDPVKVEKIVKALQLTIPPRELSNSDTRVQLSAIFTRWLPIAQTVLAMVVEQLPSPIEAQSYRVHKLLRSPSTDPILLKALSTCDKSPSAPTVVYVAKMVSVPRDALPTVRRQPRSIDPAATRAARVQARLASASTALPTEESPSQQPQSRRKTKTAESESGPSPTVVSESLSEIRRRKGDVKPVTAAESSALAKMTGHDDAKSSETSLLASADQSQSPVTNAVAAETFIGFSRVFSGRITKGQEIYVIVAGDLTTV
eukprot:CAMPEP_0184671024 /NCGR_PEP_ID=MMETSP0308-20130426/85023_1 /TAXON_ID=38269 /ORGANISM="Gloeochaete witrockiana, Strain SAG 46.84" /LENGTH=409 /DNA_ID=CAMNT_0027118023 /DNA_START=72 /DNA_END=1298 /DNA_ORIENTATION=-